MKKYTNLLLTLAILTCVSSAAFADGNAFTPLNFDDTATQPTVNYTTPSTTPSSSNPISGVISKIFPKKNEVMANNENGQIPTGNDNIQNAILELDNAQVDIRSELINYKAKYADVDAQYKLIKNERAMLHKQVKSIERRIRNIDKTKERIRRNMI